MTGVGTGFFSMYTAHSGIGNSEEVNRVTWKRGGVRVYDSKATAQITKTARPSKIFRLKGAGKSDCEKSRFLVWSD